MYPEKRETSLGELDEREYRMKKILRKNIDKFRQDAIL